MLRCSFGVRATPDLNQEQELTTDRLVEGVMGFYATEHTLLAIQSP